MFTKSYWLSKNLYFIMVSLKFHCNDVRKDYLTLNIFEDINSVLVEFYNSQTRQIDTIVLDKSTAIKFSKELRKQIALLD